MKTTVKNQNGISEKDAFSPNEVESGGYDRNITPGLMIHTNEDDTSMENVSGSHVGEVDHLDGDSYIKVKRDALGKHHWIPLSWVETVDEKAVHLNKSEAEYKQGALTKLPAAETERKAS